VKFPDPDVNHPQELVQIDNVPHYLKRSGAQSICFKTIGFASLYLTEQACLQNNSFAPAPLVFLMGLSLLPSTSLGPSWLMESATNGS
jgi:hypothetical protein